MLRPLAGEAILEIQGMRFLVVAMDDQLTADALAAWANEHNLTVSESVRKALVEAIHA